MLSIAAWRPAPVPFAWWVVLPGALLIVFAGMLPLALPGDAALWSGAAQFVVVGAMALGLIRIGAGRLDRRTAGFDPDSRARALLVGVLALAAYYALSEGLGLLKDAAELAAEADGVRRFLGFGESAARDLSVVAVTTLFAPLGEELAFRALVFRGLRDGLSCGGLFSRRGRIRAPGWLSLPVALAGSAAAFIAVHGGEGQDGLVLEYALFATVMALAYHLTGWIAVPVTLHALINAVSVTQAAGLDGAAFADSSIVWLIWAGPALALSAALLIGALIPPAREG